MSTEKSYEYINEFLYITLKPDDSRGKDTLVYCSGVNINRFLPMSKGHRSAANPSIRGLQTLNHEVRAFILSKGATPKTIQGDGCLGIAPTKDRWYAELLLIENVPESFPDEMINFFVINLIKKIFYVCLPKVKAPDELLKPDELQVYLENICHEYGN